MVHFKPSNMIAEFNLLLKPRIESVVSHLELKTGAELKLQKSERHLTLGLEDQNKYARINCTQLETEIDELIGILTKLKRLTK